MKNTAFLAVALCVVSTGIWANGTSESSTAKWPEKGQQMEMVVGFGAGGTSDTAARFFAEALNKKLGIPVVTSNRVGATGSVAGLYVSKAKPDGYTVGYEPIEGLFWKPMGMAPISLTENFTVFGLAVQVPATITIKAKDPRFSDIKSLLDYAKANPGMVKVGTSGVGSNWELAARLIEQKYGVSFKYVPYEGGANAAVALLQGSVDLITNAPGEFISQIKSGDFIVLGMMTEQRAKFLPEIPTCKEQGYDLVHAGWGIIAGPKNIPADITAKISEIVQETYKSEAYQNFAMQRYLIADTPMDSEKATEFARTEWQRLEPLIKSAGWIK
jgi:tripartite-type tricarboxylate transporter receptor subunit TctC